MGEGRMMRPAAFSCFSLCRVLLQRYSTSGVVLPVVVVKPYICRGSSTTPSFSSLAITTSSEAQTTAKEDANRLKTLAKQRREFDRQTANLRKRYAEDILANKLQKEKIESQLRKEIEERKASKAVAKKERAAARAIEVAEEELALQAMLKERSAVSAQHRARMEGRQNYIGFKRRDAIRRQSSLWIEEKSLERRIVEAVAHPYQLAGSSPGMERSDTRDESYDEEADEA